LIEVRGHFAEKALHLTGFGEEGRFVLNAEVTGAKLSGQIVLAGLTMQLEAERTTRDYPEARRPEKRDEPATAEEAAPRGKPREPRADPRLEPLRRALDGQGAVVVQVERADEIVACVEAFAEVGLKPILLGASEAHQVTGQMRDRVAGVLLTHQVLAQNAREGIERRNRYADLQAAGIPVAFHSDAEDGARDLFDMAAFAVLQGMSPSGALRALTADAARMYQLDNHVGLLAHGRFGDVVLLDRSPLDPRASVVRVLVAGQEVR
jgi:imidazolonepropionase-like amidohydrolase